MQQIKKEIERLEKLQPTDNKGKLAKIIALDGIYKTIAALLWIKLQHQTNAAEKRAFNNEIKRWQRKFEALQLPFYSAQIAYHLEVINKPCSNPNLKAGGHVPQKNNDSPFVNESENVCNCANVPPLPINIPCKK